MDKLLILFVVFFLFACDKKDQAQYIAKSVYADLSSKYEKLELENKLLKSKNIKLNNENEVLKHDLKKYKNGFKSMYE